MRDEVCILVCREDEKGGACCDEEQPCAIRQRAKSLIELIMHPLE